MVFWLQKEDEDEGRITCGNTILSGSVPVEVIESAILSL